MSDVGLADFIIYQPLFGYLMPKTNLLLYLSLETFTWY